MGGPRARCTAQLPLPGQARAASSLFPRDPGVQSQAFGQL